MAEARIETLDMQMVLTVARLGSFSAAATELRMAAPSVSTRMASLERRLGARLFERRA
jgi:DNA-binding transcriptional LysR family regulator